MTAPVKVAAFVRYALGKGIERRFWRRSRQDGQGLTYLTVRQIEKFRRRVKLRS